MHVQSRDAKRRWGIENAEMERTGKKIYNFVKKKLDEAKDELAKIGDGYKYSDNLDTKCCVLEAKIKSYEEVLKFISAEPKIVGTTTVSKALERFLLDQCPEVKKKLKAFEIIKSHANEIRHFKYLRFMAKYWEENKTEITKELLYNYDFPYTIDEFDFLKEVMK